MSGESIIRDLNLIDDVNYRARKTYKKRLNALEEYSDAEFKKNYRFNKETVLCITRLIEDDINTNNNTGLPVPPLIMVLITLRHLAKGSYQLDSADIHGVSQKTVSNVIRKVVNALAAKLPQFVSFPDSNDGIRQIKRGFLDKFGFPQCLGAIDCTQIKIKDPGGEMGARHRCRKGFYSLNVQVLVDSDSKILDIVARWRGSAHDSRIFNSSSIKRRLENMNRMGGVILGDGGYKQSKIMMTPFRLGTNLTEAEQSYQRHHILARGIVERTFGQFKNCFRCCFNGFNTNLNTTKNSIVAMAVLWNISKNRDDPLIENTSQTYFEDDDQENANISEENLRGGRHFRTTFINRYFSGNN